METLADALPRELARVRKVLAIYHDLGPAGSFGAAMIEEAIRRADKASAEGDVVQMVQSLQELRGIKE